MRLLFDQNLSRRLVRELAPWFPDSGHVAALGLETATDREIWAYAGEHGYLIVSKDSDFRHLAFLLGPPPKAVWLSVGNCATSMIADLLRNSANVIGAFIVTSRRGDVCGGRSEGHHRPGLRRRPTCRGRKPPDRHRGLR